MSQIETVYSVSLRNTDHRLYPYEEIIAYPYQEEERMKSKMTLAIALLALLTFQNPAARAERADVVSGDGEADIYSGGGSSDGIADIYRGGVQSNKEDGEADIFNPKTACRDIKETLTPRDDDDFRSLKGLQKDASQESRCWRAKAAFNVIQTNYFACSKNSVQKQYEKAGRAFVVAIKQNCPQKDWMSFTNKHAPQWKILAAGSALGGSQ